LAWLKFVNLKTEPTADALNAPPGVKSAEVAAAEGAVTGRDRFLAACHRRPVDRTPIWLMRQAGRVLPEYRALREKHSFVQLVQTPELAAEVTLQPIRRFDFDAAVLFSDILVVAEAMGQRYGFREQGGVEMAFAVRSAGQVAQLDVRGVGERLQYVGKALALVKSHVGLRTAVLGFAGSPWTLANFMVEGGSAPAFTRAAELFYTDRALYLSLLGKLTEAVTEALRLQIDAGADAVQIFDSLGGVLAADAYEEASGLWIRQIIDALKGRVPVIVFARGLAGGWDVLARSGAQVLSADWRVSLPQMWAGLPGPMAVQGNLDPALMTMNPDIVERGTRRLLESMRGRPGHVFNLGHGLPPTARIESIERLVATVREFR
jgi:uroporphyrinogen decarboxylase